MRGSGGILLDAHGKRFADELSTRSVLTDAIFEAGTPMPGAMKEGGETEEGAGVAPTVAYLVLNQEAADAFGTGMLGFYMGESRGGGPVRRKRRHGRASFSVTHPRTSGRVRSSSMRGLHGVTFVAWWR